MSFLGQITLHFYSFHYLKWGLKYSNDRRHYEAVYTAGQQFLFKVSLEKQTAS